ncbi:hypothetical protein GCM10027259_51720 [Micromonospora palomenae]
MLTRDQIALQEALREQQQFNPRRVSPVREVLDDRHCRVHLTEDLPGLAGTDPHRANLPVSRERAGCASDHKMAGLARRSGADLLQTACAVTGLFVNHAQQAWVRMPEGARSC